MIDCDPKTLAQIKTLIKQFFPGVEIRVFGSRVKGTARQYSDIDCALVAEKVLSVSALTMLKEALSQSNIPILVDIVDWHTLDDDFKAIINQHYEILQP